MQYLLMIHSDEKAMQSVPEPSGQPRAHSH